MKEGNVTDHDNSWSPVVQGALTRPWQGRGRLREQADRHLQNMIRSQEDKVDEEIIGRVEQVSKKIGKSMAQVAIAW